MGTKLLPCPFCGGEASIGFGYGSIYGISDDWFIECADCGTTNVNPTRGHSTKEQAVEAWNRRANDGD